MVATSPNTWPPASRPWADHSICTDRHRVLRSRSAGHGNDHFCASALGETGIRCWIAPGERQNRDSLLQAHREVRPLVPGEHQVYTERLVR